MMDWSAWNWISMVAASALRESATFHRAASPARDGLVPAQERP